MKLTKKRSLFICLLLTIFMIHACGESDDPNPVPSRLILVSPAGDLLDFSKIQSVQLRAIGFNESNDTTEVTSGIAWSVSNEVASVDGDGKVTFNKIGATTVTAEIGDLKSNISLEIWDSSILISIRLTLPGLARVDLGETKQLKINGYNSRNLPVEITDDVQWTTSNDHLTISASGVATGVSIGETVVTATVGALSSSLSISIWDSTAPRTDIYVSDAGNFNLGGPYKIYRYDEMGRHPEVYIDTHLDWPQDIVFLEDQGVVLVSNLNSLNITKYNIETGEYIEDFASVPGGPTRMKMGADGLLYVLQWAGSGTILRYESDGTRVADFNSVGVSRSIGFDWDSDGNIYVSSYNTGSIVKLSSTGEHLGAITESMSGPTNLWINDANEIVALDWTAGVVKKFALDGTSLGTMITGLGRPEGIDILNGNILIGNGSNGTVKKFKMDGTFIEDLVSAEVSALKTPNAVVLRKVNQ